jgi:hypothetical protein
MSARQYSTVEPYKNKRNLFPFTEGESLPRQQSPVILGIARIARVEAVEVLGVTFTGCLSVSAHVQNI